MSTIIIPGRWKRQPTGNVVVSNASPVSLGITQAFPLIGNGQNAVKGGSEQIVLGSGGSYSQDSRGIYLSGSGSGQGGSVAVNLSSYGTLTLSWWMWWNTFANDYDMAFEYTADGLLNDGFWISPNSGGGTQKFEIAVGAGPSAREFSRPSAGAWHHYMVRMRRGATAADVALSVDGVPISGTNTGTNNTGALFANSTLNILGRNSASLFAAARMQNIILRAGYYAPDWLAAEEYAAPWAMYEKHARILYFPSAGGGGATLTVQDLAQGHSLGSPSLTQHNVLAVQGLGQAHTLGAPTLTQHQVLAVDAIAQAHALGAPTLTQAHILTVQGLSQAHSLGAPSLTQHNLLTPDALTQAQTLGNISLTVAGSIAAADIAQGHSLGSPSLTQHNVLTVAALMQAHSLGEPSLAQAGTLAVQGMTQGQVLDAVALVQHHALAVQAILQAHALGNVTLTASDALAIDGLTHAQILGAPSLTQYNVLAVQGMTHAQILQAVTLGGLVIGSLRGTLVAYSLIDGEVVCRALLSGSPTTVH